MKQKSDRVQLQLHTGQAQKRIFVKSISQEGKLNNGQRD